MPESLTPLNGPCGSSWTVDAVDVHGAGFQLQSATHRELQVVCDHRRCKPIACIVRQPDRIVGIFGLMTLTTGPNSSS